MFQSQLNPQDPKDFRRSSFLICKIRELDKMTFELSLCFIMSIPLAFCTVERVLHLNEKGMGYKLNIF